MVGFASSVLLLAVATGTASLREDPNAQAVLDKVAEVYATAEDLTATGRLVLEVDAEGETARVSVPTKLLFKRPNKLRVEWDLGVGGVQTNLSDGRHAYCRMAVLDQYSQREAPQKVSELESLSVDLTEHGLVDVFYLLDGGDPEAIVEEVAFERAGLYEGQPVYVLRLVLKGGHEQRLWVGQDDFLIRKSESAINTKRIGAAVRWATADGGVPVMDVPGDAPEGLRDQVVEAFSRLTMQSRTVYREMRANSGVPDSEFRFRIRPRERRVKVFDAVPALESEPTAAYGISAPPPPVD